MRIVIRAAAMVAVLAVYYGVAALLPDRHESAAGLVALATVAIGGLVWAWRDGGSVELSDGARDWLVVSSIVAVLWWVTLLFFEGFDDVASRLSDNFFSVVLTAGLLFAPALLGLVLGRPAPSSE